MPRRVRRVAHARRRGGAYVAGMKMMMMLALAAVSLSAAAQEEAFLTAVRSHDVATVRDMLEKDPALANAHRPDGISAVMLALLGLRKGEEVFQDPPKNETLQAVLARKPKFDIYDTAALGTAADLESMLRADPPALQRIARVGWTLLHAAAFAGNVATTELLIRKGADVNARAKNRFYNTPLHTALLTGQYATTKLLLDHGADVHMREAEGASPLHLAAESGRVELIQLLLDHGAEKASRMDDGQTAYDVAASKKFDEAAKLLK